MTYLTEQSAIGVVHLSQLADWAPQGRCPQMRPRMDYLLMTTQLREAIAEIIASGCGCDRMCNNDPNDCGCRSDADKIIALINKPAPRFDKVAYQREYMRKWRKAKA